MSASELAPFVAAVLEDRVVEGVLEENRRLREEIRRRDETIENIRSNVREIKNKKYTVTWGAETDDNGWTTYSSYTPVEDEDDVNMGPCYQDMEMQVFCRAELRFGTFFSLPTSAYSLCYYVEGVQRNPRSGQLEFEIELSADYFDDSKDDPGSEADVTIWIEPHATISIDQFAVLSGLSVKQIQSKDWSWKVDEASPQGHVPLDIMDALERVWGRNCAILVFDIQFRTAFIERKCLLL